MVLPSLPQTLIPAVSFLAWFIVNWLKHSPLAPWKNAIIALLVPVFAAIIWSACSGGFTQNLWGDIGLIVTLSYAALALPELESWRQWLQDTFVSPFALWDSPTIVDAAPTITASTVPAAPTPYGIDLRSSAVPPSRRPQFVDPSPSMHSRPIVSITVPSQNTEPMETPESAEPVEEPPSTPEQA